MSKFIAPFVIILAMALSACGGSSNQAPESLTGTWKSSEDPAMIARVSNGKIQIDFTGDTEELYWTGTFDKASASNGTQIVSNGDTATMDEAILASQDDTKKFIYKDGKLSFFFSIMGMSKTVHLER